jgi:hypothetical protein
MIQIFEYDGFHRNSDVYTRDFVPRITVCETFRIKRGLTSSSAVHSRLSTLYA